MKVNAEQLSGWEAFHADRTARRDAAGDDALRSHFEAELEQARITMEAMGGGAAPEATGNGAPAVIGSPDTSDATGDAFKHADRGDDFDDRATSGKAGYVDYAADLSSNLPAALQPYADEIAAASEATGVPANLLAAVIWDESKGVAHAATVNGENGQTDTGLMQVNPETFAAMKEMNPDLLSGDASDPASNIMAGALYLAENKQEFGSWDLALRAYNSGPLSVDVTDASVSTTGLGTKNYVEKVNYFADLLNEGEALPDGYPGGNEFY